MSQTGNNRCQYSERPYMGRVPRGPRRLWLALRGLYIRLRGRLLDPFRPPAAPGCPKPMPPHAGNGRSPRLRLMPGEWVRVRPLDEIRATLDDEGRCDGLVFMPSMARFCGMELRVKKRVEAIFDEAGGVLRQCRDTVLLETVICDGMDVRETLGCRCDRSCFYFWHEGWLERVHVASSELHPERPSELYTGALQGFQRVGRAERS